jgi:hypothetical protein
MAKKGFLETFSIMFTDIKNITDSIITSDPLQSLTLDSNIDIENPEAFATALEETLFNLYGLDTEKYKSKFRSLQVCISCIYR